MSDTITLFPKKHRSKPKDGLLRTEIVVGIHKVTFETDFLQNTGLNIFWIPGRDPESRLIPRYKKIFDKARFQHLQRVADIVQMPLTVKKEFDA